MKQIERERLTLCSVSTPVWAGFLDWHCTDSATINYRHHRKIEFEIAV
jgi:hypothetical protein